MSSRVVCIEHVQIAAPPGCEAAAREFYGSLLGMREIEKPNALRARGGCWFQCGNRQFHIGIEQDFRPAKKAHVAFIVSDLAQLREGLRSRGIEAVDDTALRDAVQFYADDPWGNRLEFIQDQMHRSAAGDP